MAFMPDQIARLLRTKWTDPNALAQELHAIFSMSDPIKIDSPVQLDTNSPDPSLTITNNFGDDAGIGLQVNGGTVLNGDTVFGGSAFTYAPGGLPIQTTVQQVYFPADGPPVQPGDSSLSFEFGKTKGGPDPIGSGPPGEPGPDAPGGGEGPSPGTGPVGSAGGGSGGVVTGGGGLVGIVQSGTGSPITVTIYPNGFSLAAGPTVSVIIPNIDATEIIDPGTKIVGIIAVPIPGTPATTQYYFQPPVWMS